MKSGAMFTNSGMFTARFDAVIFSTRIAGLSLPFSSMWARNNWVNSERPFEENASQRPFGEKVCQEFIRDWLQFIRRAVPPSNGTMYSSLAGRMSRPFLFLTNTIHLPSGETLGKLLLIPSSLAPRTGSGLPPLPSLNGIRYRSYWICVSSGELAYNASFAPAGKGSRALARENTRYLPSGLQKALV